MDADLVGAPCQRLGFHQRVVACLRPNLVGELLQDMVLGDCFTPTGLNSHPLAVLRITANGCLDTPPGRLQVAIQQGCVRFVNLPVFELLLQRPADFVSLGNQDKS